MQDTNNDPHAANDHGDGRISYKSFKEEFRLDAMGKPRTKEWLKRKYSELTEHKETA